MQARCNIPFFAVWLTTLTLLSVGLSGCKTHQNDESTYRTVSTEPFRNTAEAQRENQVGMD